MTLKASAANGASSSAGRVAGLPSGSPLTGSTPDTASTCSGDGNSETIASSSGCTPLFLKAEPQRTGVIERSSVAFLSAAQIRSSGISFSSRYISMSSSSASAQASIIVARASATASSISAGTSVMSNSVPRSSW